MFKKTLLAVLSVTLMSCGDASDDTKSESIANAELENRARASQSSDDSKVSLAEVEANLKTVNPRFANASIVVYRELSSLNLTGLYEASIDGQALVVTADGNTAIVGDVYSLSTMTNLTRSEKQKGQVLLAEQEIEKLSEDDFVTYPATGEKVGQMYVFSDTTCGYCKKFHKEIADYQQAGIEVKYIPYPRSGLREGDPAFERMKQVMCAEDKKLAMTEIKAGTDNGAYLKESYPDACVESIVKGQVAGRNIGLQGTPFIYLEDANIQIVPGYQASENLIPLFKNSRR